MKRLALFSMLLSLSLFTIGCAPPAEEATETPPPAAEGEEAHEHAEGEEHSEAEMTEEEAPVVEETTVEETTEEAPAE